MFKRSFQGLTARGLSASELLPVRLAKACVAVLPVEGAGLSAFTPDGFRIPLGGSDELAAEAERLQFTLGEGPCLHAHQQRTPVLADRDVLAANWPVFHAQLTTHTPFRAVVAVPLRSPFTAFGSLDLMLNAPVIPAGLKLADVDAVAAEISRILLQDDLFAGELEPAWTQGPTAQRRRWVFIASGMLNVDLHLSTEDSLALLRAYAFRTDRTIDDVADDIAHRRITSDDVGAA